MAQIVVLDFARRRFSGLMQHSSSVSYRVSSMPPLLTWRWCWRRLLILSSIAWSFTLTLGFTSLFSLIALAITLRSLKHHFVVTLIRVC